MHMSIERTAAGMQMVMPGCERRTLPKSTSPVDDAGQGLLTFYRPPSLREEMAARASAFAPAAGTEDAAEEWSILSAVTP